VSYKRQELLTLREHPGVLVGFVLFIVLVFCVVFLFVCPCFVSCVFIVANVSGWSILDFPFGFL